MFQEILLSPSSWFNNPKESLWPQYGVYTGESVGCEVSVVWCQPIGLLQVVGMDSMVVVSVTWKEMLCDRRNSNQCDSETQENTHISKMGGRKRK
jgi:hypothetical protein